MPECVALTNLTVSENKNDQYMRQQTRNKRETAQGPMATCYHSPPPLALALFLSLSLSLSVFPPIPPAFPSHPRFSRFVSLPILLSVLCILLPHDKYQVNIRQSFSSFSRSRPIVSSSLHFVFFIRARDKARYVTTIFY
ncbi:hypothetical protein PUN28_006017 [Cardiocondyla obscurior]|uniref:Transmembrane protein n=1 Tax=Cardiocondyla obscurior TaxID=286306 RepID=A0AAW2GAC9_9HYME